MLKVNLIAVGKVKEKYFSDGIAEYSKRLSRFCEFKIIEVTEEPCLKENPSEYEIVKKKEGAKILPLLKGKCYAMAIEGKKISSKTFSDYFENASQNGGEITFIIGGSYGLDDSVKQKCSLLSFSDMTFPHTLFRLMLTEQIYRAFSILNGSPYHK